MSGIWSLEEEKEKILIRKSSFLFYGIRCDIEEIVFI
jgi:hypothetical protein